MPTKPLTQCHTPAGALLIQPSVARIRSWHLQRSPTHRPSPPPKSSRPLLPARLHKYARHRSAAARADGWAEAVWRKQCGRSHGQGRRDERWGPGGGGRRRWGKHVVGTRRRWRGRWCKAPHDSQACGRRIRWRGERRVTRRWIGRLARAPIPHRPCTMRTIMLPVLRGAGRRCWLEGRGGGRGGGGLIVWATHLSTGSPEGSPGSGWRGAELLSA